jgi:hypothetical protein
VSRLQNVTITLPADVLTEAKHMAVDRGVPLSHFMAELVREKVAAKRRLAESKQDWLAIVRDSQLELGPISWRRDDLHRR